MSEPHRFTDKVVVVTGAARGMGRGIAERFAAEGAAVVLADRSPDVHDTAAKIAAGISAPGADAVAVTADVTDEDSVAALFAAVAERHGRLDVLVNNAGTITISKLEDLTVEDWNRVLAVNTTGAFLCAKRPWR